MAIQNRRGYEADFDPAKMLPGEWAVSLDTKYVRMCFAPGECLRMATYEGFEQDMEEVRRILAECQDIQAAIEQIQSNISDTELVIENYVSEAKKYRDEAKQFRDEAETFAPEGYADLVQTVADNTVKIDTVIEKAELNIKNTASGENIHLTDSADSKVVEFGLHGKAEQKQYSGKNRISGSDLTWTASEYAEKLIVAPVHLEVGTYTLSWTQDVTLTSNTRNTPAYGVTGNFDATKKYYSTSANKNLGAGRYSWTINITEENDYSFMYWMHTPSTTVTLSDFQLENGEVATPYEPFVGNAPSPSPDYPQDIEVAGASGSVEVKSVGKNRINPSNCIQAFLNAENGTTQTSSWWITTEYINVSPSEQLTFSSNAENVQLIRFVEYDSEKKYIKGSNLATTEDITLNVGNTTKYIRLSFGIGSAITMEDFFASYAVQLENGKASTEIEPYKETVATISTPDGLASIPNTEVCDTVYKYADGSGQRIQRIINIVKDNMLIVRHSVTNENYFVAYVANTGKPSQSSVISTHFTQSALASSLGASSCMYVVLNNDAIHISIPTSIASDVATLKQWLLDNNVKIYYPLATPIITDLTAEEIAEIEKLHTFYPVTNISNDANCNMTVKYLADAKNYIDNRLALIESAMINNI